MVSIRSLAATLVVLTVAPAVPAASSLATPGLATTLSGVVRDDLGRALEGVEVLVLAPEGRGAALLRALSDAHGRFVVASLNPGVYRVAADKSGYVAALGRVNTILRSSVDLVLRPVPKNGQPGAERVLDDLSWTLRVPPRSILRQLDARGLLASRDTGGARAIAARIQDAVRGEIDHVVALGSWRQGSSGSASGLEGNETRMRLAGTLGERGAIRVRGRRGSLDSSSSGSSTGGVSRGTSDVDLDVSYDTSADASLAMRAFYSTGDLEVGDRPGAPGSGARQSQRSWGYDATWRRQVDASSRVALQVGFHDASLELGRQGADGWDAARADASNRAIGAEGSYENAVGEGHLVRLDLRAQRLSLSAPDARLGRSNGAFALEGSAGWSLLIATQDQWSVSGPFAVTYGLAVRQGFGGPQSAAVTPRVGGAWSEGRWEARAEVSYAAMTGGAGPSDRRSPYGYQAELKARLDPTMTLRGTASYVPSRANVWGVGEIAQDLESFYVADGFSSDRFVALDFERVASSATLYFRVTRGRAEGALAPALDDVPVVLLSMSALDYGAARFGVKAPRSGTAVVFEYRAVREHAAEERLPETGAARTLALELAQDVARFAGGRASCRLLLTARGPVGQGSVGPAADPAAPRQFVFEHRRIGAGVALAF